MTGLVVFTVIDVLLLIAGLAFYLFWVGTLLTRIAGNLEECAEIVQTIVGHAKLIRPGVEHINETGGVVAGALPLLYGMAEDIVTGVTPRPEPPAVPEPGPHRGRAARACSTRSVSARPVATRVARRPATRSPNRPPREASPSGSPPRSRWPSSAAVMTSWPGGRPRQGRRPDPLGRRGPGRLLGTCRVLGQAGGR